MYIMGYEEHKNDSKRFMAFDYVPFDFQRGLCQINCGGVMKMPGLASNFEGAFWLILS